MPGNPQAAFSTQRLQMSQPSSFQRCHLPRAVLTPTSCGPHTDLVRVLCRTPVLPRQKPSTIPTCNVPASPPLRSLPSPELYILHHRGVACSLPNLGRQGFFRFLSFQGHVSQLYGLACNIKNREKHGLGDLFLLPRLINTAAPLMW